jgi:hypothetical protein
MTIVIRISTGSSQVPNVTEIRFYHFFLCSCPSSFYVHSHGLYLYFTCHDVSRAHFHLFLILELQRVTQNTTVSLTTYTTYEGQRTCVEAYFIGLHTNSAAGVMQSLYCSVSPMLDSCMCKTAMASALFTGRNATASIKQRLGHVLGQRGAQSS